MNNESTESTVSSFKFKFMSCSHHQSLPYQTQTKETESLKQPRQQETVKDTQIFFRTQTQTLDSRLYTTPRPRTQDLGLGWTQDLDLTLNLQILKCWTQKSRIQILDLEPTVQRVQNQEIEKQSIIQIVLERDQNSTINTISLERVPRGPLLREIFFLAEAPGRSVHAHDVLLEN